MPNWCSNTVEIYHQDPAMLERARKGFNEGKLLNEFLPVPEDLQIVAGYLGEGEAQKELERKEQANLVKYGAKNWYDWCIANWGTKWDVGGDGDHIELEEGQDNTTFDFQSAWAPPVGIYEAMVEQGYEVVAYYNEPGMCFAGIWEGDAENGYSDDYYEYSGETSKTVREAIGPELDDYYAISESMAEYEEDECE